MAISKEMRTSLQALEKQIKNAESRLKALGVEGSLPACLLKTRHFEEYDEDLEIVKYERNTWLEFQDQMFMVSATKKYHGEQDDIEVDSRSIHLLPVAERIAAAKEIPKLVSQALVAADEFLQACTETTDKIEAALAASVE